MIAGATIAGNLATDGRIANLQAEVVNGQVSLSWSHIDVTDPGHRLVVTLDGDVVAVLPAGSTRLDLAGLADGQYRVEVHPIRGEARALPDLHGTNYGRTAYLRWPASTDTDVRSYKVYQDGVEIAELDTIDLHPMWVAAPTSGTGTGRITILGEWLGDYTNQQFAITMASATTITHDVDGSTSDPITITAGAVIDLANGLRVRIDSDLDDYDVGDVWQFRVGPPISYTTGTLAEATYAYTVTALDAAGNESSALTAIDVAIVHLPGSVTNLAASYDGTDIDLSWTLPSDNDLDAVLIYANHSNLYGTLGDEIIESGPWVSLAADATSHSFTPGVDGVWRWYVRTRDTSGRISDDVTIVEVDTTGLPTGTAINDPEALTGTPTAGGQVSLAWQYLWTDGEDIAKWYIYGADSIAQLEADLAADDHIQAVTVEAASMGYSYTTSRPVAKYTLSVTRIGGWAALASPYYFAIRAGNADGSLRSTNTDYVSVEVDDTAPTLSGSMMGTRN